MPLYKGYSTKQFNYSDPTTIVGLSDNDFGPYMLTDKNLIVMDLLNHFLLHFKMLSRHLDAEISAS